MAQGLVYLHSYGVVHGNLKPVSHSPDFINFCIVLTEFVKENVLVNVAGSACLSDVGLPAATLDGKLEFSWDNVGAPASRRVAPEIFKNGESSKQSDMFSYGFVAAEVRCPDHCLPPLQNTFPSYSWESHYGKGVAPRM